MLILSINLVLSFIFSFTFGLRAQAQVLAPHKGLSFQAVIKNSNGQKLNATSASIKTQILTGSSDCVLREETHSNIKIQDGYFSLVIGGPMAIIGGGHNPSPLLSLVQIFDNSQTFSGLTCVNADNSVNLTGQSFVPTSASRRKLRLRLTVPGEGQVIVADFNFRAVGFALNSESLNGKKDTDFLTINNAQNVTQANIESLFLQFTKLNTILSGANTNGSIPVQNLALDGAGTPFLNNDGTTFLSGDGTWKTVASGGGAVTSVATRTGAVVLTSSDITDATASNTASKLVLRDPSGNFAAGAITATSLGANSVTATGAIAGGSLSATTTITGATVTGTTVSGGTGQFTNLKVYDGTANYLTQTAPAGGFGGSGYTIQWPTTAGTANQVLQINSIAGDVATLGWVTPSAGGSSQWNDGASSSIYRMVGNVGIGTDTPEAPLTATSTTPAGYTAEFINSSSGANSRGLLARSYGPDSGSAAIFAMNTSGGLGLWVQGATYFDGNIGIGTAFPAYNMDVVGDAKISGKLGIGTNPTSAASLEVNGIISAGTGNLLNSGTNLAVFGSNNTVGGGNNAFASGYLNAASGLNSFAANYFNTASGNNSAAFGVGSFSTSFGQFSVGTYGVSLGGTPSAYVATDPIFTIGNGIDPGNPSNAVTVLKNGRVGIGTTTPSAPLDVKGAIRMSGSTSGYTGFQPAAAAGSTVWTLPTADGTNGQVLTTNGSGLLSWVSPITSTNGFVNGGNSFGAAASIGTNDAFALNLKTNNATRMTIDSAGKVGIGNTSPTSNLDITGSQNISYGAGAVALNIDLTSNSNGIVVHAPNLQTMNLMEFRNNLNNLVASVSATGVPGNTTDLTTKSYVDTAVSAKVAKAGDTMTGPLVNNSNSASTALAVAQSGTGNAATFTGGNVGIGTTAPAEKLVIDSTDSTLYAPSSSSVNIPWGSSNSVITSRNSSNTDGTASYQQFHVFNTAGTNQRAWIGAVSNNLGVAPSMVFGQKSGTNAYQERMRIDASGNVGIGTTTPGALLDVKGAIRMSDGLGGYTGFQPAVAAGSTVWTLPTADGTNGQVLTTNGSGTLLWSTASGGSSQWNNVGPSSINYMAGNVGIGTTTPAGILDVQGGSATSGNGTDIRLYAQNGQQSGTGNNNGGNIILMPGTNWGSGSVGKVGVNTSSPGATLDVNGNLNVVNQINIYGSWTQFQATQPDTNLQFKTVAGASTGGQIQFVTNGAATPELVIDKSGNVGIGTTTPNAPLDVKGAIRMSDGLGGYTGFQPAVAAGSTVWTLPATDGTNGQVLTTNGSGTLLWSTAAGGGGITSLNGETGATQTFAVGTAGNVPAFTSATGTHTLNIPMASAGASVDAGLLSNSQYQDLTSRLSDVTNVATLPDGKVWIGDGANKAQPQWFGVDDLKTSAGVQQFAASCGSSETLFWSAVTDAFACTSIAISNTQVSGLAASATTDTTSATNITSGTLDSARLPTSITNALWTESSGNVYRSSGNVGIGTTNPTSALTIIRSGSAASLTLNTIATGFTNNLNLSRAADGGNPVTNGLIIGYINFNGYNGVAYTNHANIMSKVEGTPGASSTPGNLIFSTVPDGSTTASERMRISSSGYVGIGTASPASELDVAGKIRSTGIEGAWGIELKNTTASSLNSTYLAFRDNQATPQGIYQRKEGTQLITYGSDFSYRFAIGTDATTPSYFNGGNVGIGTTTPSTLLDINGASGTALKIVDGNQGVGKMLVSDANGVASWMAIPGKVTVTTATYSITAAQAGSYFIYTGSVNTVFTLPALSGVSDGYQVTILRKSTKTLTINTNGTDKFDDGVQTSIELRSNNWKSVTLMALSGNWSIIDQTDDCIVGKACWVANMIYVGVYNGNQIFTTPGGCNNSATPTCAGTVDTLTLAWASNTGGAPRAYNATVLVSGGNPDDGATDTATLAGYTDTAAAAFCNNLNYAGQTDWYLPAKNEMRLLGMNAAILKLGLNASYATTGEVNATQGFFWSGNSNIFAVATKDTLTSVRCIRKNP